MARLRALVIVLVACGPAHPPVSPPPPGFAWRGDLQCLADSTCAKPGSDCAIAAPPTELDVEQCGGTEKPPPTSEERARYRTQRADAIAAQTWTCACRCAAAEARAREACMLAP